MTAAGRRRTHAVIALVSGGLFSAGVCIAGMVRPGKVLGFLDLGGSAGGWDASLLFVMASALVVHALAWRLAGRRSAPWLGGHYPVVTRRTIEPALVAGAALFGLGWGLSGYCPGPAVVSLVTGQPTALVFVAAMVIGLALVPSTARSDG